MSNETLSNCTCLTAEDATMPHYETCPSAAKGSRDNTDLRCLAELAAYRDLECALYILKAHYRNNPSRKAVR